jgi:L-ascorbate metabolism protein UlaG (beta-lactamase superfamily)
MKFTYYGQSCFAVEINSKKLLFDPFISGNPLASHIQSENIEADYIFVSHGHEDHVADLIVIAKRTKAQCIASAEIANWLQQKGVENVLMMNHGGYINFSFGKARGVNAVHSAALPDGSNGGNPMGFVFNTSEGDFYYAGDTALTMDMQLIPLWAKLKFAVLPIGGHFTMDITDALYASNFIQCNTIIGVHYNTFGYIEINTNDATAKFEAANKQLLLPQIGETIEL